MSTRSMDQLRAEYAWQCVKGQNKDYKNLAKSLPAMVMTNGLMQTLAFLEGKGKSKEKDHHRRLKDHVVGWLQKVQIIPAGDNSFSATMESLYKMNSPVYQRATAEALEIMRWLRQLADAAVQDGD